MSERAAGDSVSLRVDGMAYAGWTSVRITRGIDRAAADFDLGVTRQYWPIRAGSRAEIWIGGDRVLTGFVDDVEKRQDARSRSIAVQGRSLTCDIVDCSTALRPGQWANVGLARIVADLLKPYGVAFALQADAGAVIADFRVQQEESVITALHKLAGLRGLLVSDDADGRLLLFRPGTARAAALVVGARGNVKSFSSRVSQRDRFHTITVRSQQGGFDIDDPALISGPEGSASDGAIRPSRRLVLSANAAADSLRCRDQAAWEVAKRAGQGLRVEVTVPGWRQSPGGPLWQVNQLAPVINADDGLEAELLIAEVGFELAEQGSITRLVLAPPSAYTLLPEQPDTGIAAFAGLLRNSMAGR